ncbi:hypothetical protein KJZ63_03840 [Patescibacteria group bacterium]|nr:hypothetical protein [Patescibacteria group bacterium]
MKLRVLLLAFVLASGLFFSSFSVKPTYAITESKSVFDIGAIIKEVGDLISGVKREKEENKDINKMSVDKVSGDNFASWILLQLTGSETIKISGAIPTTGKAISDVYKNAPASGQTYVADLLHNMKIGPAQPAYAQVGGLGFAALEPILGAWKQFRNIAYMFFIIITLVIGFMIMMRQKVGGQAAVTAQQAIPNVVIALIGVTFSYAVAGFMIDLMYVFMYLMAGLFSDTVNSDAITKNILELGFSLFVDQNVFGTSYEAVGSFTENALTGSGVEGIAKVVTGLSFAIIIAFAYLFAIISLYFELLKTYVSIIINIVLSPLLLMLGALPGRNDVFQDWVKSLLGNLVAYPVVLLLIIIHKLLTSGTAADGGFLPPYLMGRGNGGAITTLVGLGVMLIAKDLVVQAKKSVNPKGSGIFEQFGSALSQAVSKGWKGGELIPGVGLTDTNKLPFGVGKYVGSGKGVLQSAAPMAAGLGGAAVGAAEQGRDLYRWAQYRRQGRAYDLSMQGLGRGPQAFKAVDKKIGPGKEASKK